MVSGKWIGALRLSGKWETPPPLPTSHFPLPTRHLPLTTHHLRVSDMSIIQPRIYLASQSPRRRELLKQIGINFELLLLRSDPHRDRDLDETPHAGEAPQDYVQRVCRAKAEAGYSALQSRSLPPFPVLAADTTVTLDGRIFGKPDNAAQAAAMLRQLSGCEHQVLSAVRSE